MEVKKFKANDVLRVENKLRSGKATGYTVTLIHKVEKDFTVMTIKQKIKNEGKVFWKCFIHNYDSDNTEPFAIVDEQHLKQLHED